MVKEFETYTHNKRHSQSSGGRERAYQSQEASVGVHKANVESVRGAVSSQYERNIQHIARVTDCQRWEADNIEVRFYRLAYR